MLPFPKSWSRELQDFRQNLYLTRQCGRGAIAMTCPDRIPGKLPRGPQPASTVQEPLGPEDFRIKGNSAHTDLLTRGHGSSRDSDRRCGRADSAIQDSADEGTTQPWPRTEDGTKRCPFSISAEIKRLLYLYLHPRKKG